MMQSKNNYKKNRTTKKRDKKIVFLCYYAEINCKIILLGSSEEAASYVANTFMIYTGTPQNTRRKPIEELNIEKGKAHMDEKGMNNIVVHALYIINIANT